MQLENNLKMIDERGTSIFSFFWAKLLTVTVYEFGAFVTCFHDHMFAVYIFSAIVAFLFLVLFTFLSR